jgi:beta-barrel assembly-enhancing protease
LTEPQFSNPRLPDEVNNSDATPLRSFLGLLSAVVLAGAVAVAVIAVLSGELARHLPYELEAKLIAPYSSQYPPRTDVVEDYLQGIADRLVGGGEGGGMALPHGMSIRVHYVDQPVVNAFATLGGHVVVFRGLLDRMPDENVLAMIMAHEIAHVRHRHPIASLGRGLAFSAMISMVSASAGNSIAQATLGQSGLLTLLSFSRAQELEADASGIAALASRYGHVGGATETFSLLQHVAAERGRTEPPTFLNTHPVTQARVEALQAIVDRQSWKADGVRTPLPAAVRDVLERARNKSRSGEKPG